MPAYWVNTVAEALNQARKPLNGSRVLVLGVTYKPDVSDLRESPALEIIRLLEARGAVVSFHDPFVASLAHDGLATPFQPLSAEALATANAVVVATNHSTYDWAEIKRHSRLVVDTRHSVSRLQSADIPNTIEVLVQ